MCVMGNDVAATYNPAQHLVVGPQHDGQRVDNYLSRCLKGVPRTRIYRILRRGEVRVNKGRIDPAYRLRRGDIVRIPPLRYHEPQLDGPPSERCLETIKGSMLYEDAGLIVVNKPVGVAVHGGSGKRYGVIEAMRLLRPELPFLELVHRLDRDTSGCLLLAKKRSVLKELHQALRERRLRKRYVLLARGPWSHGVRRVESALRKNILRCGERMVHCDAQGKPSITLFQPLVRGSLAVLLQAIPVTGRTHQIRAHAAFIGHPVAGDAKYGDRDFNQALRAVGLRRLFLHALAVELGNYAGGDNIVAPLPTELHGVLEGLGISYSDPSPPGMKAGGRRDGG